VKDEQRASEVRERAEVKVAEKKQDQAAEDLSSMPKWVLEPPKADGQGIYAVGMAESDTLRISMRKAMLEAEFGLAKLYKQEISGSERMFDQERGTKNNTSQYTALIDKLVARVPVVGFEVIQQEVKPIRGIYHTWVLLKLPYAQFNKVLLEQKTDSLDQTVKEAFDDLEKRVRARQEDRLKEDRERQAMRLNELNARGEALSKLEKPVAATTTATSTATTTTIPAPTIGTLAAATPAPTQLDYPASVTSVKSVDLTVPGAQ
jgi:hypothetical protein